MTTHTLQMLTTQPKKKRAANKMYLVVLWAFAACFFICLCCEHLHHLLSKWWKCFLDLLVLFLFACVFWSCSALSSLGHRSARTLKVWASWCLVGSTTACGAVVLQATQVRVLTLPIPPPDFLPLCFLLICICPVITKGENAKNKSYKKEMEQVKEEWRITLLDLMTWQAHLRALHIRDTLCRLFQERTC